MKALFFAASLFTFANAAHAEVIKVERVGAHVEIDRVWVEVQQSRGPIVHVFAEITAGNRCMVPTADELIRVFGRDNSMDNLDLEVVALSARACTLEYSPVQVTLDLGTYTHPLDAMFDVIRVNGVNADLTN